MFRRAAVLATLLLSAAACSKLPEGVDEATLLENVGRAVGDSATCVVLAEAGSGELIWRSSSATLCAVERQACTRPGTISVLGRAKEAAAGQVIEIGCESVSWAAGPTSREGVVYAAVMYGERALPGIEIARRLEGVFADSGL